MRLIYNYWLLLCLVGILGLSGCASPNAAQRAEQAEQVDSNSDPRDPFEPVNRLAWDFNWEILDKYLLRPAAQAYVTVVPGFARKGLSNVVENLSEPSYAVNNLLQGKLEPSVDSFTRFLLNSTIGVVGIFDVASAMGVPRQEEEFGEVLGVWGLDTGPFLMLPARGPTDARSFTGDVVDNLYFPMTLMTGNMNVFRFVIGGLESRAQLLGQEGQIENALDDYQHVKNIYFQNLEYRVSDGKNIEESEDTQTEEFDEFESLFDDIDLENEELDDEPPSSKEGV